MQKIPNQRVQSLDLLKGIVLLLMALDHTRDYFHAEAFIFNPLDPEATTWPIYLTRWITNFCAPAFSLLAGVSVFFVSNRRSSKESTVFLLKRGIWLIFIQQTLINFAWYFNPAMPSIELDVIATLGVSMIVLAGLVHLPDKLVLIFSIVMIAGHNLLDNISLDTFWWSLLHENGSFPINDHFTFTIFYPLVPWIGVMSLGYAMGGLYHKSFDPGRRKQILLMIGISSILLFGILRGFNLYGNPTVWTDLGSFSQNLMSALNVNKYPPSFSYLLITLGPTFIIMAISESFKGKWVDSFMMFGRIPFFFYIAHLYIIHLFAIVATELTWTGWEAMVLDEWVGDAVILKGYGFSLGVVYLIWILVLATLYPISKKFDHYKQNNKQKAWLSYF
ncbi:MAG: DUF1624 domain-containing protein [Reichenbachiella sp.]